MPKGIVGHPEGKTKAEIFSTPDAPEENIQKITIPEAVDPDNQPTYLMESNGILFRYRDTPLEGVRALRAFHDEIREKKDQELDISASVDILLGEYQALTEFIIPPPMSVERTESAANVLRSIFSLELEPVEFETLAVGLAIAQGALNEKEYRKYEKYLVVTSARLLKNPGKTGLDAGLVDRLRRSAENAQRLLSK